MKKFVLSRPLTKIAFVGGCATVAAVYGYRAYEAKANREKSLRYESEWGPKVRREQWSSERAVLESEIAIRPFVLEALKEHIFESKRLAADAEKILVQKRAIDAKIQDREQRARDLRTELMRVDADRAVWLAAQEVNANQTMASEIQQLISQGEREQKEEADRIAAECAERTAKAKNERSLLTESQIAVAKRDIVTRLNGDRQHCESQRRSAELANQLIYISRDNK